MINFNDWEINTFRNYGGANGNKICMMYNDQPYMVKIVFPNELDSSVNSAINEHIGCNIFRLIGIKSQETILGTYQFNGKDRLAVACKDFNIDGYQLQEFLNVKNTCIKSSKSGNGTSLLGVLSAIDEQNKINSNELKDFFWDMFIVDAFIGNFDRHNGNWGILSNEKLKTNEIAPIYDCGSCLYSRASIKDMKEILSDKDLQNQRIFQFPTSAIKDSNNKKINYFDYISSGTNDDCSSALCRILPRIDMSKIKEFINDIDEISYTQKQFYCTMLDLRKERILDFSFKKLKNNVLETANTKVQQQFYKREQAIINQVLSQNGITGQYQKMYRDIVLTERFKTGRHNISTQIDTKIVATMLIEKKYPRLKIRQTIIDYSPNAVSNLKYADRIMNRAKSPKYKNEALKDKGCCR